LLRSSFLCASTLSIFPKWLTGSRSADFAHCSWWIVIHARGLPVLTRRTRRSHRSHRHGNCCRSSPAHRSLDSGELSLTVVAESWLFFVGSVALPPAMLLMSINASVAMLGPGSWSIDAILFGRRRLAISTPSVPLISRFQVSYELPLGRQGTVQADFWGSIRRSQVMTTQKAK
jgi:hypothetical protein